MRSLTGKFQVSEIHSMISKSVKIMRFFIGFRPKQLSQLLEQFRASFERQNVGALLELQILSDRHLEVVVGEVQMRVETNHSISYQLLVRGVAKQEEPTLGLETHFLNVSEIEVLAFKDDSEHLLFVASQLNLKRKTKIYDSAGHQFHQADTLCSGLVESSLVKNKLHVKGVSVFVCHWIGQIVEGIKQTVAEFTPMLAKLVIPDNSTQQTLRLIDVSEELLVSVDVVSVFICQMEGGVGGQGECKRKGESAVDSLKRQSVVFKQESSKREILRSSVVEGRLGAIDFKLIKLRFSGLNSAVRGRPERVPQRGQETHGLLRLLQVRQETRRALPLGNR